MTDNDPRVREAVWLAQLWQRSTDVDVRKMGADLAQILGVEDKMPPGFNRPMTVDKATLVDTLRDLLSVVEADDSAGGFVEYEWSDEPGKFDVRVRYRIGNSMGQGGMRILHE